jgi:PhnB protein
VQFNAYLNFDGRCEEAFEFYEQCFGGKIESMIKHEGTPAEKFVPPDWRNKIMHTQLNIGDQVLMGSDAPPEHYEIPKGFSVSVQMKDPAEAERVFNALAVNGTVRMALSQTFWSVRFGMCVDRFGIPWIINCTQVA